MSVRFESVIDGLNRYIDKNIYSNLNATQEFVARLVVGRINQNSEMVKQSLMSNGFFKTLCIIDSDGMVDIDNLLRDVRKEIDRQGSLQVEVPLIGKLTFRAEDVDEIKKEILGGVRYENN